MPDALTTRRALEQGGELPASESASAIGRGSGNGVATPEERRARWRRGMAMARPALALVALVLSVLRPEWARLLLAVAGAPVVFRTLVGALRGQFAADLVASMAIVGAVVLNEPLAGLVVVLMQTGGEALERWAEGRASAAVRALEAAAPRVAHRLDGNEVVDVPSDVVQVGDLLLVRPGELVPCDAIVERGSAHVDTSRLTGEPVPRRVRPGDRLSSGVANGESPLVVRAIARAAESQYARIVQLVRTAQASKAPIQRTADRYAVWFTPLTLLVCAAAWLGSGDPVRVLAVLVVATPCPLILAAPIAVIGGINRLARRQVIVRHGTALERLAAVNVAVFDKTGTLTLGRPNVAEVRPAPGWATEDVLRLAAAVEQGSGHLLAASVVDHALERRLTIPPAAGIVEEAGRGVVGTVEGRQVRVGSRSYVVAAQGDGAAAAADALVPDDALYALVAVDDAVAGALVFADEARAHADDAVKALRALGIERLVVLSGDREATVRSLAQAVGISELHGDLSPEDKVDAVNELMAAGHEVLMVGDGTNDAPALSAASVGVAVGTGSGGIATEASDVVLLGDDLRRVPESVAIARRTLRITKQSIRVGLALSGTAMLVAAFGYIEPAVGALLQEGIDLAVIANALRASRDRGDS